MYVRIQKLQLCKRLRVPRLAQVLNHHARRRISAPTDDAHPLVDVHVAMGARVNTGGDLGDGQRRQLGQRRERLRDSANIARKGSRAHALENVVQLRGHCLPETSARRVRSSSVKLSGTPISEKTESVKCYDSRP